MIVKLYSSFKSSVILYLMVMILGSDLIQVRFIGSLWHPGHPLFII